MTPPDSTILYRERLWPSVWFFLATALVIPASLVVFLPINETAGVVVAILLYAACVAGLIAAAAVVEVTGQQFSAGRAHVPVELIGDVRGYREPESTLQRGQQLDARAWLLIRGWVAPVVRIELTDPKDPTPYWLVSTRHPDAVAAALEEAKGRQRAEG